MIYKYRKYKNIDDFVHNKPKSKADEEFTILDKCNGLDLFDTSVKITNKCFSCLFCYFSNQEIQKKFKDFWGYDLISTYSENAFNGNPIDLPKSKQILKNPFYNLASFTETNETENIQPWATGLLHNCCSKDNRISMEVPVFNPGYDRNGRLDICSITDDYLIVMESKTTLDDALADERFVEQRYKYISEIEKSTNKYVYLTLFGGKETDLYPSNSMYCTSQVGQKSERFYKLIRDNNIKFLSADALWLLVCKFINSGSDFAWDNYLIELFSKPENIGLVSAGIIKNNSDNIPTVYGLV